MGMAPAGAVFYGVFDLLKTKHQTHMTLKGGGGGGGGTDGQPPPIPPAYTLLYGALAGMGERACCCIFIMISLCCTCAGAGQAVCARLILAPLHRPTLAPFASPEVLDSSRTALCVGTTTCSPPAVQTEAAAPELLASPAPTAHPLHTSHTHVTHPPPPPTPQVQPPSSWSTPLRSCGAACRCRPCSSWARG